MTGWGRLALVLGLLMSVSGCMFLGSGSSPSTGHGAASYGAMECRYSPDRCAYDGPYEPGERAYAEAEARRLNQAELERLRRFRF